ncbi:MAG: methionine adenosyltransferase [Candidatus Thermoplasmatota archaeon]|nr:methionine adenosyltransferase [Candidatus Thermoplasmatota archaeon]MBS3790906.1 methionine adenosyltransferase [Candidatus Thermoplasmatota archaeon]
MSNNIEAEVIYETPIENQNIEIVERKGIGHPDSVADGIAEEVSKALSRMYLEKHDRILHHNTDEVQIVGGQAKPVFGGGEILEPVYILLAGRATTDVNGKRLPYKSTALNTAENYLEENCPHLDVDQGVMLDCRIGKGSVDLQDVYDTSRENANDTSFGVSYAPLSETEKVSLEIEKMINGPLKKDLPEVGQDIKVMSARNKDRIDITIAAALIDSKTPDPDHYISVIEELEDRVLNHACKFTERDINLMINTADDYENDIYYLTVTGLSMENGDDGSVGRGNRVNGLITPFRPMSMEAAAGKNPVTHIGKLYNIAANEIAQRVYEEEKEGVHEVLVRLVSQIGNPITEPQVASIQLVVDDEVDHSVRKDNAEAIAEDHLENIYSLKERILKDEITVF